MRDTTLALELQMIRNDKTKTSRRSNLCFQFLVGATLLLGLQSSIASARLLSWECASVFDAQTFAGTEQADTRVDYLKTRYGIDPKDLKYTPKDSYPVLIRGTGQDTLRPKFDLNNVTEDPDEYDAIVVGSGPAGLTSALYLTDAGKKVLIVEREERLGGLAAGSELNGVRAGGGAAYSAGPDGEKQYRIFQHIGLGDYKKQLSIHEPIDSYLWKGKYYDGIWEEATLAKLPRSFTLFKFALKKASARGMFSTDTPEGQKTDLIDMAAFVRQMPKMVSEMTDPGAKEVYNEFLKDPEVNRADPMADVIALLDLYGRSALGGPARLVSARQFGDFYVSELETRYTGTLGTGTITGKIIDRLNEAHRDIKIQTSAPVAQIENEADHAYVTFVQDGKAIRAKAKKVIFAAAVTLAPSLIKNFAEDAPDRMQSIKAKTMTDYGVYTVRLKGHPFRGTYDLWMRPADYSENDPTDVIQGRWMDPDINGYQGMRNFERDPKDDYGVFTIYHPLGPSTKGKGFTDVEILEHSEFAIDRVKEVMAPLLRELGTEIKVELVEANRWPFSIHVVRPGSLAADRVLAKPLKSIFFANNTLGAPELESALELGYDAAQDAIREMGKKAKAIAAPSVQPHENASPAH